MNQQQILDELLALLEGHDVTIRSEPMGGSGGGLCAIKGTPVFFLDTEANATEAAIRCAEAVKKVLDTETIYIRPEVRQFIDDQAGSAT